MHSGLPRELQRRALYDQILKRVRNLKNGFTYVCPKYSTTKGCVAELDPDEIRCFGPGLGCDLRKSTFLKAFSE